MESSELGASVALHWAKAIGQIERKLGAALFGSTHARHLISHAASLSSMSPFKPDRAKMLASQLVSKGYYTGEAVGFKFGRASGKPSQCIKTSSVPLNMRLLRCGWIERSFVLRSKARDCAAQEADCRCYRVDSGQDKHFDRRGSQTPLVPCCFNPYLPGRGKLTMIIIHPHEAHRKLEWDHDLAHYLVALPFEAFTQSSISAGIECWSWVIAEKPTCEVTLMSEIAAAWDSSAKVGKGMFSKSQK